MRLIRLFSIVLSAVVLTVVMACSSDDDNKLSVAEAVVGTWVLESYDVAGDDAQEGVEVSLDRLTMTADGRYTLYYPEGDSESGTYEVGDDYIRFDYTEPSGTLRRLLCEMLSYTADTLSFRYRDADYDVMVTINLRRKAGN